MMSEGSLEPDSKSLDKFASKKLIGKGVVGKTGKRLGDVGDFVFEVRSGEIINVVVSKPTSYAETLNLEKDSSGNFLVPFSSVLAIGDFLVISEEDLI